MLSLLLVASARADEAAAKKKELGAVQKELEATRKQIEEYKKLEDGLGRDLTKLEGKNADARRKMDQLQRNLRLAEEKKNELKAKLGALGAASGFWRGSVESDARGYAALLSSRNDVYGTSGLWAEHLRRQAIREKTGLISSLQGFSAKTLQAQVETRRKALDLLDRSRRAKQEQESGRQEYERTKAAMADAQEKHKAAVARATELEESARALTRLVRALGNRKPYKPAAGAVARLDVPRNSLAWPAAGSIIKPFGRQRNPELDAWVISQGILLATVPEAPVQAVQNGRVIFAGPFRSYGQVLIVDHGSSFFSIYGELGELLKQKGSEVRAGETIARAGASGGKGSVYLELRRGTEALDPMAWLEKR